MKNWIPIGILHVDIRASLHKQIVHRRFIGVDSQNKWRRSRAIKVAIGVSLVVKKQFDSFKFVAGDGPI